MSRISKADWVWNDLQRDIFRKIRDKQDQLDAHDRARELLTDEYSILVADLMDAKMPKLRIMETLRLTSHRLADLLVRADTARAIRDMKEVSDD